VSELVLPLLHEAQVCMLLSVSYVLQLVKFTKPECPKKSGYLTELILEERSLLEWLLDPLRAAARKST